MVELRVPRGKKLTKPQREMLEQFATPTVERRWPLPKTISNALNNGYLRRVGRVKGNFAIFELTDEGRELLRESSEGNAEKK